MNDYHWDISCDALTGDIVMELYRNGLMTDWSVRELSLIHISEPTRPY